MSCHTSMSALWSDGRRCTYNSHRATNITITMYNDLILNMRLDLPHLWYAMFFRCLSIKTPDVPTLVHISNFPTSLQLHWECTVILLVLVSVPSATAPLPSVHVPVDSCVIRVAALTTSLMSPSQNYQTMMIVLFLNTCQCFYSPRGVCTRISDEEYFEQYLSYLMSLYIVAGSERGRGGWVPFLKFTWTCVQTTARGFH